MQYVYPAVFNRDDAGIGVIFPDFDGCVAQGDNGDALALIETDC